MNKLKLAIAIKNKRLELTAKQALKIEDLSIQLEDREMRLAKILTLLVCIGGPLNDNKDGYTKEQLKLFHRICSQAEL